ncbi:hypothetical protein ACO0LC_19440 [Undibacterium sp. JH2W]|uniref:hypothetical protein n=1 Tax=Undibacterium sp. JH2W TaxID=3413037 RepID=UPI003BEF7148
MEWEENIACARARRGSKQMQDRNKQRAQCLLWPAYNFPILKKQACTLVNSI